MSGFAGVSVIPVNGTGPEDVVLDELGGIYAGLADGRIIRITDGGDRIDTIARVAGRPLGIELYGGSELVVCASDHGLLAVDRQTGKVRTLVETVAGQPLLACNNAAVATSGTVYFSDSSTRFPIPQFRSDLIERTATGRLLRRDTDGTVTEILSGLQFANGVALAPDESFVLVAETGASRIHRVWLSGDAAGSHDVFAGDITGFPDNISTGTDGLFWVAVPSPPIASLPVAQALPAPLRAAVRALPESLQPSPGRAVGVLGIDPSGVTVREYRGEIDGFVMLTGVREQAGKLYCGSLAVGAVLVADR